jgi:PAS domain S-box-containing protein
MNRSAGLALEAEYRSALEAFLDGGGESALQRAYGVGRRAIADGLGILELSGIHFRAVASLVAESRIPPLRVVEKAAEFYLESVSPFEMALSGFREANATLQRKLAELQATESELQRQHASLEAAHRHAEAQEQRYREQFHLAPDAYLVTDMDALIEEANQAAGRLLNAAPSDLTGRSLMDYVSGSAEALRRQLRSLASHAIEKVEAVQTEIGSDAVVPIAITVALVNDIEGRPTGFRWMLRDITELKRLEAERTAFLIREQVGLVEGRAARRLAFLAEASRILGGSLERDENLAYVVNLILTYLSDWCAVELTESGRLVRARSGFAPELRSRWTAGDLDDPVGADRGTGAQAFETSKSELLVAGANTTDPRFDRWRRLGIQSVMWVPLRSRGRTIGRLTLVRTTGEPYEAVDVGLAEDLAARMAVAIENAGLYQEVALERDRVHEANQAKDEFISILSHELSNPLTPVLGWIDVLKRDDRLMADDTLGPGICALERNVSTISQLVADCLDLTRIDRREITLSREPVDMRQLLTSAVGDMRQAAEAKGLKLVVDLDETAVFVRGDQRRLGQVMMNLLSNAVKYTNQGFVAVRSRAGKDAILLEIEDSGIGIDPEFMPQLFRPFRRATSTWLNSESGLGIGLSITRHIVNLHGGEIAVRSEGPNCGATFLVELPLDSITPVSGSKTSEPPSEPRRDQSARILLIDDSEDVLLLMKLELELLGHSVATASRAYTGIELARTTRPDVIISDIKMPQIDGYRLIRHLRSIPDLADTPVIALTGLGMKKDVERALNAGYTAHLTKPVDVQSLARLIQNLCNPPRDSSA